MLSMWLNVSGAIMEGRIKAEYPQMRKRAPQ
jgi:hypothetical protein